MPAVTDGPSATIPRSMLQDVLAEHLTKTVIENPEQRDELIHALVKSVLSSKEYDHDKMTYAEKFIRRGIGEAVEEIAKEWVEEHRDVIKEQIGEALQKGMVKNIVADLATAIGDRIKRGY